MLKDNKIKNTISSVNQKNIKKAIINIDESKKETDTKGEHVPFFFDKDGKKLLYEPDEEFELKSCCGSVCSVDKSYLEFLAKTIVSLSVLGFCFLQLSQSKQSEFASSTISLILGTYLGSTNSPVQSNRNKNL